MNIFCEYSALNRLFSAKIYTIYLETNTEVIARKALEKEDENDAFRNYLGNYNADYLDSLVKPLAEAITPRIDCTACGACCRSLMINVTDSDALRMANGIQMEADAFKNEYLEESMGGQKIMKSMPCHFLNNNQCTQYEYRFTECREFPHLHRKNFKGRLFGTLVHYAMCPIIYNVVEELKVVTGFKDNGTHE